MDIKQKTQFKVPFGTMNLPEEAINNIMDCIQSRMLTCGRYVQEFEENFAKVMGVKYAVAVSSGTDADTLALACLYDYGAKRGVSEVIIPSLTFIATANAVLNAGFVPVFVDIDRNTLNIDARKIEEVITENTIAIMPVHLMGNPCEMNIIMEIARKNNLYVVEDCAEAHGASINNKMVGSFGDLACYSLYAAHIISSIEGGMITTNSQKKASSLKSLRNHGLEMKGSDWEFSRVGFNSKMNELEASVGIENLNNFKKVLAKRKKNLIMINRRFQDFSDYFYLIQEKDDREVSPHAFPIIVRDNLPFSKTDLTQWYTRNGIDHRNLFYSIPTQVPYYKKFNTRNSEFPEAEYCSINGTHIGIHQNLDEEHIDYVYEKTKEFLRSF